MLGEGGALLAGNGSLITLSSTRLCKSPEYYSKKQLGVTTVQTHGVYTYSHIYKNSVILYIFGSKVSCPLPGFGHIALLYYTCTCTHIIIIPCQTQRLAEVLRSHLPLSPTPLPPLYVWCFLLPYSAVLPSSRLKVLVVGQGTWRCTKFGS